MKMKMKMTGWMEGKKIIEVKKEKKRKVTRSDKRMGEIGQLSSSIKA